MAISMYQASVPVLVRALENLRHILQKGEAFAADRGFDAGILLQTRLVPDMLPLVRQVQIAADMSARCAARLAGEEPRSFADEETTFEQLYARLDREHRVERDPAPRRRHRVDGRGEAVGVGEQRRDVLEHHARARKIGNVADQVAPVGHGGGLREGNPDPSPIGWPARRSRSPCKRGPGKAR